MFARNSGVGAGFLARMIRWRRIIGASAVLFVLLTPGAQARTSPYAKATLVSCDREAREAVFEGRVLATRKAAKMQLRFTLQALTPDETRWRKIDAEGFATWITAPSGLGKYTYDKTVQDLLAPASYRAVIDFRWRDRAGKTVRTERAISPICKQPDARPDLIVRSVKIDAGEYSAVIFNRGREAAGPFAVDFLSDSSPLGTVEVTGLAPQTAVTVMLSGPACTPFTPVEAVADPRSQVDEADEENDSLGVLC
jgi:CARDB protein